MLTVVKRSINGSRLVRAHGGRIESSSRITQSVPLRRWFGVWKETSMLRTVLAIATAISTALLVASVGLNAYLVTLAIRAIRTSVRRERTPTHIDHGIPAALPRDQRSS